MDKKPEDEGSLYPYVVGNTLTLRIEDKEYSATIISVILPFTLSCVMVVQLDSHLSSTGSDEHMILKLYDRRFATGLRDDEYVDPWTPHFEQKYREFLTSGRASELFEKLHSSTLDELEDEDYETWDDAEIEADLQSRMQKLYHAEVETYNRTRDLQGRDVPRFIARVSVLNGDYSPIEHSPAEYYDIPGILLEKIYGFPLNELAAYAPKETWQTVCEDAIRITTTIGDREILNEDVKVRNFIVQGEPGSAGPFKVFQIDFALCKFRGHDEDEQNWWWRKASQDEEGAVGYGMQHILKKGGFIYRRSEQYNKLDKEFKSE